MTTNYVNPNSTIQRYQGRRVVGPQGAQAPNLQGFAAASRAFGTYLDGLGALLGATGQFANKYFSIVNERKARDAGTAISKALRDQYMSMATSEKYRGKGADNLMADWEKSKDSILNKFYEDNDDIPANIVNEVFTKYNERYMDRVGALQVERQQQYDVESRTIAVMEAADSAAMSQIGSMPALMEPVEAARELFPNDPLKQRSLIDNSVKTTFSAWMRQNPAQFLNWMRVNKDEVLKQVGGAHAGSLGQLMQQAENQVKADISFSISMQNFRRAEAERALKKSQEAAKLQFFKTVAAGEAKPGMLLEPYKDEAGNVIKGPDGRDLTWADAMGADNMSSVLSFSKAMDGSKLNPDYQIRDDAFKKGVDLASTSMDANASKAYAAEQFGQGNITFEQYKQLTALADKTTEAWSQIPGGKDFVKYASEYAESLIAPKGALGIPDPSQRALYMDYQMTISQGIMDMRAKGMTDLEIIQQVDPRRKDSWARSILQAMLNNQKGFSKQSGLTMGNLGGSKSIAFTPNLLRAVDWLNQKQSLGKVFGD